MAENPKNRSRRFTPEENRQIRADLARLSDDDLFRDIEESKAMRRHPYATPEDERYLTARISLAQRTLTERLSEAIDNLG